MAKAKKKISVSKKEEIIILLKRKSGASIDEMMTLTGWQAHSVRGVLSGTVKKKLGLALDSQQTDMGVRKYYVLSA